MSSPVLVIDASGSGAAPVSRPPTPEEQAALDAAAAADAARITYGASRPVEATATTTDAAPLEVFRFPTETRHLYIADLTIKGIDRGNFVSRVQHGEFTWKRPVGVAVMVGITVLSNVGEPASASWAPNAVAAGTDIVFTVAGAAGRTIDWRLNGSVEVYAPGGLEA